jgi:hypothetical protein
VKPLSDHLRAGGDRARRLTPRLGAIINYTPALILYVSQPFDNSIKAINLTIGGPAGNEVFVPTTSRVIRSQALDVPVDLAPVHIESEDTNWSSNTTMEQDSDFYVCNAGNDTIVRLRQSGAPVGRRRVRARGRRLGHARLNGIATSPDGMKIWVTYVGELPGSAEPDGGVLELPAF